MSNILGKARKMGEMAVKIMKQPKKPDKWVVLGTKVRRKHRKMLKSRLFRNKKLAFFNKNRILIL